MRTPLPMVGRRTRRILVAIVALIVLIAVGSWVVSAWTDWLWFREVSYTSVFATNLRTKLALFAVFGVAAAVWLGGNIQLAYRLRPKVRPHSPEQQNLDRYRSAVTPRMRLIVAAVAIVTGLITGLSARGEWAQWLLFRNAQRFGTGDPQFGTDIGFYVFKYPFYRYLIGVGFTLVFLALVAVLLTYWLYGGVRLSGRGDRITNAARLHLSILVALFVVLKAVAYFLDQRGLLLGHTSTTGTDGAGYTAINALLPAKQILAWIALVVAVAVLVFSNAVARNLIWPGVSLALLAIAAVTIGGIYPGMVSTFTVKPNIPAKEGKYIQRSITATRAAYGIQDIGGGVYPASNTTPDAKLAADRNTVPNVRLLDPAKVPATFTQLQQVRGFYDFGDKLNVDRYTVDGRTQDYVVGVRQLDSSRLSGAQRTWQNRHAVFTHGYGFVAAPADTTCADGQPSFVSGSLGDTKKEATQGDCYSGPSKLDVRQPRIYYSDKLTDFAIVGKTGGADREYDRPGAGGANAPELQNTYDGSGGVPVGSYGRRLLYALDFHDSNFLLASDYFNADSKLLYVRDPRARVEKVAPFLTVDGDPYPAVVGGRVQWILDCYTTSSTYPYSQRTDLQSATSDSQTGSGTAAQDRRSINYIRNSVKATVDAYTGKVTLYQFDRTDPVLKAWNAAYGGILKTTIPADLAAHFRYPEDLFKVQRDTLNRYHITDPQAFNKQDNLWETPKDPTRSGGHKQPPYYVVAQFPQQNEPTFQLTAALTSRNRNNLAAILSAYYDSSGRPKLAVTELPGNSNFLGPNQVQSKMQNQEGIQNNLALGDSKTSSLDYGNLLTLPVADGLLYVEPVYIKGKNVPYPLLKTVLVGYGSQVGYGPDLKSAIANMTSSSTSTAPPGDDGSDAGGETGTSPDIDAAVRAIDKALADLSAARKADDYAAEGKALAELKKATKQYEDAKKAAKATASPGAGTPSPGAKTPSPEAKTTPSPGS
ncbi:UPF0182 family protein [Actinocatenispora sera]|uniref:UPF0182 family membrane protein n=1 Tax=Actinocatenispora sera TaxID=390989 RepID=UPI0033C14960